VHSGRCKIAGKVAMSAATTKSWISAIFSIVLPYLFLTSRSAAADQSLDIVIGGQTRQFGRDELLRRPDVVDVAVANDVAYGKAMNYRALPLAALLAGLNPPPNTVIESVALDGFAAQLPLDPIRAGLTFFVIQCLPCHTLNGAGAGNVGQNRPKNPTQYMTRDGLHALIRDPRSVRIWPTMQMPGFSADKMSDREIGLVIAYLTHMAKRRGESR
jgi:mono/diheme cytochrome c family protein